MQASLQSLLSRTGEFYKTKLCKFSFTFFNNIFPVLCVFILDTRSLVLPSLDNMILLDIYHYNLTLILLAQVLFDVSISEDVALHDVK